MRRVMQAVLIVSTLVGSWVGMQAVHEAGHVLAAWATGGRVARVVLHPLTISRTDLAVNPNSGVVAWGGPVGGVVLPLLVWAAAAGLQRPGAFVLRFFAGFCLVANGVYLGLGSFSHVGDCGEMLRHGSMLWQLWLFAAITTPLGLWLWHGQGRHFGLGSKSAPMDPRVVYGTLAAGLMLALLAVAVGGE